MMKIVVHKEEGKAKTNDNKSDFVSQVGGAIGARHTDTA